MRQHFVSRSFQRLFANAHDRIMLIDKERRSPARPCVVSTADAFVEKDFSTFRDRSGEVRLDLEMAWSNVESACMPLIRQLNAGADLTDEHRAAVMSVASMHWARSPWSRRRTSELLPQVVDQVALDLESDGHAAAAFEAERGRLPHTGELAAMSRRLADDLVERGEAPMTSMENLHNKALSKLADLHLQLLRPRGDLIGFAFGDTTFVNANTETGAIGMRDWLALGDSDRLYMPLGRYLAVLFTARPFEHVELNPSMVKEFNTLVWEASRRFVGMHPSEHPGNVIPNFRAWAS